MKEYQEWVVSFECESGRFPQIKGLLEGVLGEIEIDPSYLAEKNNKVIVDLYDSGFYSNRFYDALAELKNDLIEEKVSSLSVRHSFSPKMEEIISKKRKCM